MIDAIVLILIAQLDNPSFRVREQAQACLERIESPALWAYQPKDPEARARLDFVRLKHRHVYHGMIFSRLIPIKDPVPYCDFLGLEYAFWKPVLDTLPETQPDRWQRYRDATPILVQRMIADGVPEEDIQQILNMGRKRSIQWDESQKQTQP